MSFSEVAIDLHERLQISLLGYRSNCNHSAAEGWVFFWRVKWPRPSRTDVAAGGAEHHDHAGNISAQLEYAARRGSRWHYPAVQHAWREEFSDGESTTTIDFVLIDTVLLCGMPRKAPPLSAGEACV